MKELIEKMKKEAYIIDNRIIKVDHFINHMLDSKLVFKMGKEFADDVVFAKKARGSQSGKNVYQSKVFSYTKQIESIISVDKLFLTKEDKVLIIDDFLATGEATTGLIDIVKQSGAKLVGVGIVIEKGYENGGKRILEKDIKLHSLARIKEIKNGTLIFEEGEHDAK